MKNIYQKVNIDDLINIINNEEITLTKPNNLEDVINKIKDQFKNNAQPYDELLKNYLCVKVFKRALMDSKFKIHEDDTKLAEYYKKKDQEDRRFLKVYHYLFEYKIDEHALEVEEAMKYHYPMLQIKINTNFEQFKSKILDKVIDIFNHTVIADFDLKKINDADVFFKYKADDKMLGKVVNDEVPLVDIYKLIQHILSFDLIDVDMPLVPVIQEPFITRIFCFDKKANSTAARYVFNTMIMSNYYKTLPTGESVMSLGKVKKICVKKGIDPNELDKLKTALKDKKIKLIIK